MRHKVGILFAVYAAVLTINLDITIVNVALPSMAEQLDADTKELQWIVDAYTLTFAALVLAAGSWGDRFGRRPALILGLLGFAAASVAGALAPTTEVLIAARAVMGLFAALIFPTTLSIISHAFTDRTQRAAALGGWGAIVGVGVASGPVTGGALLEHFYWGSIFWALVPVALLATVVGYITVPESRDPNAPRLDRPGLALSTVMLGVLVFTIIEAPEIGWNSPVVFAGFAVSVVAVLAFVTWERRVEHPMLDVRLFADPRFSAASFSVMAVFFALAGFIFLITQYFQLIRGFDPLSTGLRILPVAISIAIASIVSGLLAPKLGTKSLVVLGLFLFGSAMLWITGVDVDTPYWSTIVPQMVMMGLGMGFISTPATESILQVLPPERAGIGSAVNDATREVGATLGVAIVGSVFSSVYAAALARDAVGLPNLDAAQDSVRSGLIQSSVDPAMLEVFRESFMSGLSAGCLLVGLLCYAAAAIGLVTLPGPRVDQSPTVRATGPRLPTSDPENAVPTR